MSENLPDTNVGNIEYISKQYAVDALKALEEPAPTARHLSAIFDCEDAIKSIEPADVVPVEILKAEIYKLKCQQDSKNQDYYTGYMSALSTVEGILAEMGEE